MTRICTGFPALGVRSEEQWVHEDSGTAEQDSGNVQMTGQFLKYTSRKSPKFTHLISIHGSLSCSSPRVKECVPVQLGSRLPAREYTGYA